MQHGIDSEPHAAAAYKQQLLSSLPPSSIVTLLQEGLLLHVSELWLAASPDAIVVVQQPGQLPSAHLLEIKCPHSRQPAHFQQQLPQHADNYHCRC